MSLLAMQAPVRLPSRGLAGRITGYEWVDGVFRCYAVECEAVREGRRAVVVVMAGPEEVEAVDSRPGVVCSQVRSPGRES